MSGAVDESHAAVDASERAAVGWFDRAAKQYRHLPVGELCALMDRPES